jgi:hypothetical protein
MPWSKTRHRDNFTYVFVTAAVIMRSAIFWVPLWPSPWFYCQQEHWNIQKFCARHNISKKKSEKNDKVVPVLN